MEIRTARLGNIRELLTNDQMKKIKAGQACNSYKCCINGGCSSCVYTQNENCPSGEGKTSCC